MYSYLKKHQKFVEDRLEQEGKNYDWEGLREFHQEQIGYLQHERMVHMFVMLFVALFLVVSMLGTFASDGVMFWYPIDILLLGLTLPYVVHYFRLENGVQYYYHLANRINAKCGRITANYEEKNKRKNH